MEGRIFVSVPCRSSSDVDLKKPIKSFIEKTYGSSMCDSVSPALDTLQELRKTALQRLRDKSLSAAKQVATYHDTLLALESRVSMTETEARVDWKWTDICGKSKKLCTSLFERANIIFCYAAIHSQIAESCDIKDPDKLKQAVISLKLASGVFDFLASNSHMFGHSGGSVTVDIMSAYSAVMYAQAEECVLLKAEQGNVPSQLVAKVASKTRECFEDGLKKCNVSSVKPAIPKDWFNNLSAKVQLYSALSQYYQSKACEGSKAFGERVARLAAAYDLMKATPRSGSIFGRQNILEQIKRERESAMKDNDFIYHEHIPTTKELTPVPSEGTLGKMELKLPLLKGEVKDIFTQLVPLSVLEVKNHAQVVHHSLVIAETHRLREATNALNAVMVSLNLPAAVQLNSTGELDSGLLKNAAKIRQQGGVERLREHVYSLPHSAERNREILHQQQTTLDDEEKTDDNLRAQFGERWTRQPSRKLNEQWRNDIQKMCNFLVETEKTDKMLASRFEEHAALFELLSKSDDEILATLRSAHDSSTSPSGSESGRQALAQLCSQVESLKADRNSLTEQFDALKLPETVVSKLTEFVNKNGGVSEQNMLDILNVELEGSRECVRASERRQEELLAEIQAKYEECFGHRASDDTGSLATRLNAAVDAFFALDKDVKEGMKFYAELTERCLKVQEKIDDFCLARTTEKTEHMADITSSLGRVTVAEGPAAPSVSSTATTTPSCPPPTYHQQPAPTTTAPAPVAPPIGAPTMQPPFGQPGVGWAQPAYGYGMPMYGYYPGFAPMPSAQMPPLPNFQPMIPGQHVPYMPGQPPIGPNQQNLR
ncbi:hypothetical protein P879_08519 [Paragonimus westermani]|uniref:BRO1 domain-containing protein n=1 Tax=Paragonimus westermani TaxID=34504 RepID=A0A8T0D1C0_9TREM|nr:hypothetical protein P879_08519 [Paragonimus westermani]